MSSVHQIQSLAKSSTDSRIDGAVELTISVRVSPVSVGPVGDSVDSVSLASHAASATLCIWIVNALLNVDTSTPLWETVQEVDKIKRYPFVC